MHITIQKRMHQIIQKFKLSDAFFKMYHEVINFCFGAEALNKCKFLI